MDLIKPNNFKTILVAVDDSEQGQNALANGIHQAQEDDSVLVILSVLELGELSTFETFNKDYVEKQRGEIRANLDRYERIAKENGIKNVEKLYAEGSTAGEVIINFGIKETNADLVVIGAHSKRGITAHMGSQASYVGRRAPISVLIVRN